MGSNRRINSDEEKAEIQQYLMSEFGTSTEGLYDLWKEYISMKLRGEKHIVSILRKQNKIYNNKLDYFTTLGFELFSSEFARTANEEKNSAKSQAIQKEFDFG